MFWLSGVTKVLGNIGKLPRNGGSGADTIRVPAQARHAPGEDPVCCGRPMESRLARAHDRSGQTLFVAVWQCPACGRVIQ
jgi:hypothetical protein